MKSILTSLAILLIAASSYADTIPTAAPWQSSMQERLATIESEFPGEIGVYVQHLESGSVLSWRAAEQWYLASMIKVPVAIELFARIDMNEMTLEDRLELTNEDYVDGAGQTNWQAAGSPLKLEFLLDQMLTVSDNTATDMLIRHLGIGAVNARAQSLLPAGSDEHALGPITTLVDVRRRAYGFLHPRAEDLGGLDFLALRKVVDLPRRLDAFAEKLSVDPEEFVAPDLESAFEAYYATPNNSGRLDAFAAILSSVDSELVLSAESRETLLEVMYRAQSGERRIKAGLPDTHRFAHKTGTQLRRACDGGLISAADERPKVVVVACTRGSATTERAEQALAEIGQALATSGLLSEAGAPAHGPARD